MGRRSQNQLGAHASAGAAFPDIGKAPDAAERRTSLRTALLSGQKNGVAAASVSASGQAMLSLVSKYEVWDRPQNPGALVLQCIKSKSGLWLGCMGIGFTAGSFRRPVGGLWKNAPPTYLSGCSRRYSARKKEFHFIGKDSAKQGSIRNAILEQLRIWGSFPCLPKRRCERIIMRWWTGDS